MTTPVPSNLPLTALPSLDALDHLPRSELIHWFQQLHHHPPPLRSSRDFLISHIAWAIQSLQGGQDPLKWRVRLISDLERAFGSNNTHSVSPGSRLIREWQGVTHEVLIMDTGYAWQGKSYRSLTAIASEITGTHWSGPAFFGLKRKGAINGRKQQRINREANAVGNRQ